MRVEKHRRKITKLTNKEKNKMTKSMLEKIKGMNLQAGTPIEIIYSKEYSGRTETGIFNGLVVGRKCVKTYPNEKLPGWNESWTGISQIEDIKILEYKK